MRDVPVGYIDPLGYLRCKACACKAATPVEGQTAVMGRVVVDGDVARVVVHVDGRCDCCKAEIAPTFDEWRRSRRDEPEHAEICAVRRALA